MAITSNASAPLAHKAKHKPARRHALPAGQRHKSDTVAPGIDRGTGLRSARAVPSHPTLLGELRSAAERFAAREAIDPDRYPAESVAELTALGLFSAPFPVELGGVGQSLAEAVTAVEALACASPSLALLACMPMGLAGVITAGSQRAPEPERGPFFQQVAAIAADYRASVIYAAGNSEKGAGGSLAATRTAARRDGQVYRLSGEKMLASFGRYASVFFSAARLPEGSVELFLVESGAPGVTVRADWDGFGMRATESHSVLYEEAPARAMLGYPGFLQTAPVSWWWCVFAAIPLGCVASMLATLTAPPPGSPALRLRLSEALMRYEAARAYLLDTASRWRPDGGAAQRARVLRAKTYVSQECTRLAADLFALSGGRHYTRHGRMARSLADVFAGTALRPPLPLALDQLVEAFSPDSLDPDALDEGERAPGRPGT
jgi:alkylation response protein AidB-like acyl-CoA dehydrogenase